MIHYLSYYNSNFYFIASKGIGENLLKVGSKRRRTQAQIVAEKEEARLKEEALRDNGVRLAEQQELAKNN